MKNICPPKTFWQSGQSFLIIAPKESWQQIINSAVEIFAVSKFDKDEIGLEPPLSIEQTRSIENIARQLPTQGEVRLCIIFNADKCGEPAANSLLKILEEVPLNTRFLLLAETRQFLPTIRSRCSEWSSPSLYNSQDLLIPLERNQDFATVSLKINKIVEDGQATLVLDQWANKLIKDHKSSPLRWIIEARNLLDGTALNASALLEATYLHLVNNIDLPTSLINTKRPHGNL